MRFIILLLLTFPLFGKQSERYYQEKFAREIGGRVEVVMKDGTRCDILTATHAIEVDFAKKWAEADWTKFKLRHADRKKTRCCIDRTFLVLDNRMHGKDGRRVSLRVCLGVLILLASFRPSNFPF